MARQKQTKQDTFKQINQGYQEGRVYTWLTGSSRPMRRLHTRPTGKTQRVDRPASSDSDRPIENPSTNSDSRAAGGTVASIIETIELPFSGHQR